MWARVAAAALCACAWLAAGAAGAASEGSVFGAGAAHTYEVLSEVSVGEAGGAGRGAVAYQLRATLQVARHWPPADHRPLHDDHLLLRFHLGEVVAWGRGAHPRAEWQPRGALWGGGTFYATWRAGRVLAAHLHAAHPAALLDYQRALLSLFQFQVPGEGEGEAERNETDVSGACRVRYERASLTETRKYKSGCVWGEGEGGGEGGEEEPVESRRVTRVTLTDARDAVRALHAEEVHAAGAALGVPLKARAYTALRLLRAEPAPAADPSGSLAAALAALPPALAPHALPLQPSAEPEEEAAAALEEAWGEVLAAGGAEPAGRGGRAPHAAALARALPAVRAAALPALRALLHRDDAHAHLPELVQVLGLAGSRAAHRAAAELLQLRGEPPQPLADRYLAALALAPRPHEWVVRDALRLGTEAGSARVRLAALLAAGAAAARAPEPLALAVRDELLGALTKCKEEECEEALVLALGNARRADTAEPLLQRAERGAPAVALAALDALRAAPPRALPAPALRRLFALASTGAPLDVRAAALDLALCRAAAQRPPPAHLLAEAARALHERGPHELRRVLWQRARELPALAALLPLLPARLRTWDARALNGTSSVLVRETGWSGGEAVGAAELESMQVAEGGVLRRGWVRLALGARPALELQLWTRGLAALAGGGGGEVGEEEAAGGGLALAVAGARQRPLTLFSGQAELLGLVWAGAGSEPTPVLRALVPLAERGARVPLLVGVELRVRARAAAALALDAHAQVSLWSRTARARLALRAGLHAAASLEVGAPGARDAAPALRAAADARSEPRLRIAADLDFYDAPALCVRVALADHQHARNVSLVSAVGARRWRVKRARAGAARRAGRTLALGAANDAACRALAPHDEDDDDDERAG